MNQNTFDVTETNTGEEVPFKKPCGQCTGEQELSQCQVHQLEESQENKFKRQMKEFLARSAVKMLLISMALTFGLYIVDVVLINFGCINSELLNPLFELLKFIISSLIGFIFAKQILE